MEEPKADSSLRTRAVLSIPLLFFDILKYSITLLADNGSPYLSALFALLYGHFVSAYAFRSDSTFLLTDKIHCMGSMSLCQCARQS